MKRRANMAVLAAVSLAALMVEAASGGVETETLVYFDGEVALEGYLAYDDDAEGRRPGVLVFHEWWGLNDYAKMRARQLAGMGYIALAADIYGRGRVTKIADEARKLSGQFKGDPVLFRRRVRAALRALRALALTDAKKIAAIGYCFGGTAALELARSGADLSAVVSFHGGLDTPAPARAGQIKARVLVLHGGDDPHVRQIDIRAFQNEMRQAGADWQMCVYGGAVHSFSNPRAGQAKVEGVAYDERAAGRAWAAMKLFFAETISLPKGKVDSTGGGGIGKFVKRRIAKPIGVAGKATGKAVKKAATWTVEKLKGKDDKK